jgi:hypothetical protein
MDAATVTQARIFVDAPRRRWPKPATRHSLKPACSTAPAWTELGEVVAGLKPIASRP